MKLDSLFLCFGGNEYDISKFGGSQALSLPVIFNKLSEWISAMTLVAFCVGTKGTLQPCLEGGRDLVLQVPS